MPKDMKARINTAVTWDGYHLLELECPEIGTAAGPGQFVMVRAGSGPYPLLRRPLSVHAAGPHGIEIFFKTAGQGTALLAGKRPGDSLDVLGPLGKGFTVGGLKEKRAFLVGGGRGIAPLYFLAKKLVAEGAAVTVFYGGRTEADLPLREKLESLRLPVLCSTDDGSFGTAGLITELAGREMERAKPDMLYACGPELMMKILAKTGLELGVRAEFSLEALMGCGIGACWSCVRRMRGGSGGSGSGEGKGKGEGGREGERWVKICEEGPVFPAENIVWTE